MRHFEAVAPAAVRGCGCPSAHAAALLPSSLLPSSWGRTAAAVRYRPEHTCMQFTLWDEAQREGVQVGARACGVF